MALRSVYNYWFDPQYNKNNIRHWIPITTHDKAKKQKEIEDRFLVTYFKVLYHKISCRKDNKSVKNSKYRDRIAIVILLDQFTRTLATKYKNIEKFKTICSHLSMDIVHPIINSNEYLYFTPNELLFVLMVYKHLSLDFLPIVHLIINNYCIYNDTTLTSPAFTNLYKFYIDFCKKYVLHLIPSQDSMLSLHSSDKNIHSLVRLCKDSGFLPENYIDYEYKNNNSTILGVIENTVYEVVKTLDNKNVCVSLSGGPDSMVLLYILKRLEKSLDIKVSAFHLIYNNREESHEEANFVTLFCEKLSVPIYTYSINFIKRGQIHREDYEKITRDIRFTCYRKIGCPIILGHIYDDVVENIITNMSTNKHLFNLKKMNLISNIEGVPIIRPLLKTVKPEILEYAKNNAIPYLKNTTPEWSNRGRFRNKFLPKYLEQYGNEGLHYLVCMSESLEKYGNIIDKMLIKPILDKLLQNTPVEMPSEVIQNEHLLREIFTRYSHTKGFGMPSVRSIQGLVQILTENKNKKFQLSKDVLLIIENGLVKCF